MEINKSFKNSIHLISLAICLWKRWDVSQFPVSLTDCKGGVGEWRICKPPRWRWYRERNPSPADWHCWLEYCGGNPCGWGCRQVSALPLKLPLPQQEMLLPCISYSFNKIKDKEMCLSEKQQHSTEWGKSISDGGILKSAEKVICSGASLRSTRCQNVSFGPNVSLCRLWTCWKGTSLPLSPSCDGRSFFCNVQSCLCIH